MHYDQVEGLLFELRPKGIAVLTFNRPERLNALTETIRQGIGYFCRTMQRDPEARVLILTGAGRAFCSGADLSRGQAAQSPEAQREAAQRDLMNFAGYWALPLWQFEKPTIAAVNGPAAGGGLAAATACDIRIASETARLGAVWVKRAFGVDAGISYTLPHIVGPSNAAELLFTGKMIDAQAALHMGLVSKVVPPEQLMPEALALATEIASQAPLSLRLIKRALRQSLTNTFEGQMFVESYSMGVAARTQDFQEGVKAFMEKREPVFKGE